MTIHLRPLPEAESWTYGGLGKLEWSIIIPAVCAAWIAVVAYSFTEGNDRGSMYRTTWTANNAGFFGGVADFSLSHEREAAMAGR